MYMLKKLGVPPGRKVLRISSGGDDRRFFRVLNFSDSVIIWGRKIWQVFFLFRYSKQSVDW